MGTPGIPIELFLLQTFTRLSLKSYRETSFALEIKAALQYCKNILIPRVKPWVFSFYESKRGFSEVFG